MVEEEFMKKDKAPGNEVLDLLKDARLSEFGEAILKEGYDTNDTLQEIDDHELREMGMGNGHIRRLRKALAM